MHPAERGGQLAGGGGSLADAAEDVAAGEVELAIEADGDRARRGGRVEVLAEQLDGRHDRFLARRERDDLVTDADGPAGDATGVAAPAAVLALGADDPLDGEAERAVGVGAVDREVLEARDERGALVPGRGNAGRLDDAGAVEGADRDADEVRQAEPVGERAQLVRDLVEARLAPVDEIHLVHGDEHVRHAQELGDREVPARLRDDALARVDEQDGRVRGRGAGDHVARVLLVPGAVGEDEAAPRREERAVGDVDRDALLALGAQAVREQREVERAAAAAGGHVADVLELVVGDLARVVQQAADQRRLAVVDGAEGGQAQQRGSVVVEERCGLH